MLVMLPSGTNMCLGERCGYHFWGVNSFDGVWHLEIAAAAFKTLPFIVPTYAGATLSGYNILMDFILFPLNNLGIPPIVTLFKIIPLLWFTVYSMLLISLARRIKDSVLFVAIVLFFGYFAGHFGYILQLYHDGSIFAGTQSFALQSATALLNTQFALSLLGLMGILLLMQNKSYSIKTAFFIGILVALNFGLKFYGGTVSLFLAGIYLIESFLSKKSIILTLKQGFIIGLLVVVSILVFYNPFEASKTGSVFTLSPFSTVHSVIEADNMVYMPNMVNARYFLYAQGGFGMRLILIELFSVAVYMSLNFGTRIFGLIYPVICGFQKKVKRIDIYLLLGSIFATSLTIMLIQKGDWWNTVQFSYYGIFLANFLAARLVYDLFSSRKIIGVAVAVIILIATIPSNALVVATFTDPNTAYIPGAEMRALNHLKALPNGVVFSSFDQKKDVIYPFLSYEQTGYVAVFTGKQVYLGHTGPLTIIGVDYKPRLERIKKHDCTVFSEVDYIYFVKLYSSEVIEKCKLIEEKKFRVSYEDETAVVYRKL